MKIEPQHFINRELSWLEFNARVLEEAQDESTPLLERLKFLSIFSSNLDEFFMVRVSGLREQAFEAGVPQDVNPDGMRAIEQLAEIRVKIAQLVRDQYSCWNDEVRPQLAANGIEITPLEELGESSSLNHYFQHTVFPIITPMAIDPSHPRPRYHNRSLYLVASLRRRRGLGPRNLFAVVQIPPILPRLIPVVDEPETPGRFRFVLLEELVASRLPELFGGFDIENSTTFRITRDSDLALINQESDDMLRLIEERLKARHRADAVRLEVPAGADAGLVEMIVDQEQLRTPTRSEGAAYDEVYYVPGPLDLTALMSLMKLPNFAQLRDPPLMEQMPRGLTRPGEELLAAITRHDVLLHHPYDSFLPVVDFIRTASEDPNVLAIKQTLYRTSGDSPIIHALVEAAENGKHVTALVELQARFDEEANVGWARQLERSGVHVVYGLMDLKTHCKVSLIVRQEETGVRRYVHLGTGNYNPATARIYTDMGLFTADEQIASDVSALFNLLTGYSQGHNWSKLVVAPTDLQRRTIELIDQQAENARNGKPAAIFAKLNSLVDPRVIIALYRASSAGVPIDLLVRGICCLRPGVPEVSEKIRVRSIVDRFLEHSRIYVFGVEDDAQVFLSSADWMPRNFHRRVEVMFPVEATPLRRRIMNEIIPTYQADTAKARELQADGTYQRVRGENGKPAFRSQSALLQLHIDKAQKKQQSLSPARRDEFLGSP
ncbi:MAG: polyphosphate kinase 1 [Planctomycetales bacterium]|nr:polyphosphate kinase 1 [Planctomycetales bacterium]